MAPIKFEDHLREKLQERELEPGKEAWSKLSDALGEEPRDQGRKYWLYGIAASLLLAIFVGRTLWGGEEQLQEPELVQETLSPQPEVEESVSPVFEGESEETPIQQTELAVEEPQESLKEKEVEKPKNAAAALDAPAEAAVAVAEPKLSETEAVAVNNTPANTKEDPFTEAKVAEVVGAVLAIQDQNQQVTPEEIDALLAKANREIANQRLLEQATGKIDPKSLLNDVEMELERSFRDKVFDALGKGFNEVRTAVVQRNN